MVQITGKCLIWNPKTRYSYPGKITSAREIHDRLVRFPDYPQMAGPISGPDPALFPADTERHQGVCNAGGTFGDHHKRDEKSKIHDEPEEPLAHCYQIELMLETLQQMVRVHCCLMEFKFRCKCFIWVIQHFTCFLASCRLRLVCVCVCGNSVAYQEAEISNGQI